MSDESLLVEEENNNIQARVRSDFILTKHKSKLLCDVSLFQVTKNPAIDCFQLHYFPNVIKNKVDECESRS